MARGILLLLSNSVLTNLYISTLKSKARGGNKDVGTPLSYPPRRRRIFDKRGGQTFCSGIGCKETL